MRTFTDSPYERMMMQVPRSPRPVHPPQAPKGHPCHGCKRYGEGCALLPGDQPDVLRHGITKTPANRQAFGKLELL